MRALASFALAALFVLLSHLTHAGEKPGMPTEVIVFESGQGGYHTYRIPALTATPKGALLAICEGRKTGTSDAGDIDLVWKRSTDNGATWSAQALLHEEGGDAKITIGNPCVVVDEVKGTVVLLFTRDNLAVFVTTSGDDGQSWTKPRDLTASTKRADWTWYATGPGNGIQLTRGKHKGRLVIPCDHRQKDAADAKPPSRSHVVYSDDHGQTWHIGGITDTHMNECAVVELADGTLMLNMRSYRGKSRRGVATSKDAGITWSRATDDPVLIEPVCQASLIRHAWPEGDKKGVLLFSNPADPKARKNMTVRLSYDEGKTWPVQKTIWKGSAIYSSLTRLPDGAAGLIYEREKYRQIVFTRLPMTWLTTE